MVLVTTPILITILVFKLKILSNGKYKSAEHRVMTTSTQSRVSIPLFTQPIPTWRIGPFPELVKKDGFAKYKEVLWQDYINNFFTNPHEGKKSLDLAKINSA
jgi:feruloyl-CoA ortho-hydroxylase